MANPYICLYRDTINKIVKTFSQSLPYHIKLSSSLSDEQVMRHVDDYTSLWDSECDSMLQAISADISYYLNYYSVFAKGSIDEFKAIYFTGCVISRFLNDRGLNELREFNDYVTIALLDFALEKATGKKRSILTKSMRKIARQNQIEAILGSHGMYMTYKVSCNIARGVEPKTY